MNSVQYNSRQADAGKGHDKVGPMRNTLYYGDNLQVLRDYVPDGSVDLVYLERILVA